MWSRLSLTEEEQLDVIIEKEWIEDSSSIGKNCLVGKLMMNKMENVEAMKNVFLKIWRIKNGVTIYKMGERLYLFHFEYQFEKDHVYQKQPWSFNKALLVLKMSMVDQS
ncbi:hypothetical protein CRYUN_Cryun36dG0040400 [Craigia yunnanensis]